MLAGHEMCTENLLHNNYSHIWRQLYLLCTRSNDIHNTKSTCLWTHRKVNNGNFFLVWPLETGKLFGTDMSQSEGCEIWAKKPWQIWNDSSSAQLCRNERRVPTWSHSFCLVFFIDLYMVLEVAIWQNEVEGTHSAGSLFLHASWAPGPATTK